MKIMQIMKKLMLWMMLVIFMSSVVIGYSYADEKNTKKINLDFQQVPVRTVLESLAKLMQENIVISDSVSGTVTAHFDNISDEKALDIILQEQGLAFKKVDNVLMIMPVEEMAKREEARENLSNLEPLESSTVILHYAKAQEVITAIKNQAKSLFSLRGSITADTRTNSLWIEEVPDKLQLIKQYIQSIDVPVKQVLIEARMVTIDEKHEKELGVRLGITRPGNNLTGSLAGASQLAQNVSPANITPLDRLNTDFPAASAQAGSIALGLSNIGSGNLLDLELSALEAEGLGEIISSPRLMTADQMPATILSGQEIPYQQNANYGTTSIAFQKAVLSLTVTPQITPHHQLLLTLQVNQDRPNSTLIQGVPEIDTREIKTQVFVNDGQTVVLGGIYEQNQNHQVQKIPVLGNLPVIGKLFQHDLQQNNRKELFIFVTPHIVR